jgi:hypothetical protein
MVAILNPSSLMRNFALLLLLLLSTNGAFGQSVAGPLEFSKNEKLSLDAYSVFRANKFLDFKEQDTLLEMIDNVIYKATNLDKYFGAKKDWEKIEAEDTSTYRKPLERYPSTTYRYTYTDTSMTESYEEFNMQYNMHKEFQTVYNLKGFVTYQEKKTYIDKKLVETQSTTNTFDRQNRAIRIVEQTIREEKKRSSESAIQAVYAGNTVTVTSNNGTIICKLISK